MSFRMLMGAAACAVSLIAIAGPSSAADSSNARRFLIPTNADQLIVVSSPTAEPARPGYLATLRVFDRSGPSAPWRRAFGPWQAETGYGHLRRVRHEGDGSTPVGVFGIGATLYGNQREPQGLQFAYHHLVCGDWWDEDPYSPRYNEFVHLRCGVAPALASWSEALWTATIAYPYFAVIDFNVAPVRNGPGAPGSGIFLHSWVNGPTAGCVALHTGRLLQILRWLRPAENPVIEIGTNREVGPG
jgi:L,D-peptidoglycan transpeptidase YkuD (ErfK/YbiS/YcfS/YnhG family)